MVQVLIGVQKNGSEEPMKFFKAYGWTDLGVECSVNIAARIATPVLKTVHYTTPCTQEG